MKRVRIGLCFWVFFCLTCLMACKEEPMQEIASVFTMTDTMMAKCEFYPASLEQVNNEIRLFGKISADNNKLAQVYPVVSGVVKSIHVELGDYVKQGQVLASIQSAEVASFQKEKLDAVNDVAIAENNVAVAEKNLQVAKDLYAGKLNTDRDVKVAEKDVSASLKELEKAKAELARINEVYKIYSLKEGAIYNITAPISGFIVSKKINQNEQFRTDISEPLFSIAEINEVWVLANVNESDISKVQVGQTAHIKTLAFPDNIYVGKIDKIFNAIDPATKSMKVLVKIPNADLKLKPEMNCTVSLLFTENKELVNIPSSSVIFDKNKYWAMVFKGPNNIETRRLDVYRQLGDKTYLTAGVQAGEKVISKNGLLIYDAIND